MHTFTRWISLTLLGAALAVPSLHARPSVYTYNGSDINPSTFLNVSPSIGPSLGGPWLTAVQQMMPGTESVIFLGAGGIAPAGIVPGGVFGAGELLCLAPYLILSVSGSGSHSVFVPGQLALSGIAYCVQAATIDPTSSTALLHNALFGTIYAPPDLCCFWSPEVCCGG